MRAALESIAYQITDIIRAMERDSKRDISLLRVDGVGDRGTVGDRRGFYGRNETGLVG